ncbi:MAG TPA: LysE family translocator [Crenalkalicoccus sp.]|jgi:threonine/homoserine/homoserine lactone efflux protein|nr:LysE family translocator [Crenalkalicoccus sp.]
MPEPATLFGFATAVLIMQATPGPDMLLVLGRGIGQGRQVALCTVLGMTLLAGVVQLPLLVLGIASLLQASPLAFGLLRWAGAAYLVWLGIRLLRAAGRAMHAAAAPRPASAWRSAREGAINNLTNPKPLLFMFAFLPQFVDPAAGPAWPQLLALGLVQKASGLAVLGTAALASGAVGGWLSRYPGLLAWQERCAGAVMVALGLRLALAGDGPRAIGR